MLYAVAGQNTSKRLRPNRLRTRETPCRRSRSLRALKEPGVPEARQTRGGWSQISRTAVGSAGSRTGVSAESQRSAAPSRHGRSDRTRFFQPQRRRPKATRSRRKPAQPARHARRDRRRRIGRSAEDKYIEVLTIAKDLGAATAAAASLVGAVLDHYEKIDILVNNAGTVCGASAIERPRVNSPQISKHCSS
jgi:hypothetical protein